MSSSHYCTSSSAGLNTKDSVAHQRNHSYANRASGSLNKKKRPLLDLDILLASTSTTTSTTTVSSNHHNIPLLQCCIHSASSLPKTDGPFNNIDPYIVALYGPLTYQSKVFHGVGSNPIFTRDPENDKIEKRRHGSSRTRDVVGVSGSDDDHQQQVLFIFPDLNIPRLSILLYDHDYFRSADDFLGRAEIEIPIMDDDDHDTTESHISETELTEWDGITPSNASSSKLSTKWRSLPSQPMLRYSISKAMGPWPTPSLKVLCHRRKVAGVFKSFEIGQLKWHKVWEISLLYVESIFGNDIQHWNVQYKKAQQIFNKDSVSSGVIRSWLSSANSLLYQSNLFDTTMIAVEGGKELLVLLKNGFSKKLQQHKIYTYVILDSCLFFSETGKTFVSDLVSKHAVHAGASTTVVYSGEFHISKTKDHEQSIFVFDNNSGTYSPDPKDLPKLLKLLKANFPGVLIDCVDYQSPELTEYKQRVGLE